MMAKANFESVWKTLQELAESQKETDRRRTIALIETKKRICKTFITELAVERAAEFRWFFHEYNDYKLYLGAAGFSVDKRAVDEARRLGMGILKQDDGAVKTMDIPLKVY